MCRVPPVSDLLKEGFIGGSQVHNGQKINGEGRIVVLDPETGAELQVIQSKLFVEPNMMALE